MGEAVKLPVKPRRWTRLKYACACLLVVFSNVLYLCAALFKSLAALCETWADDLED